MNETVKELNLPLGEYVVFGSGPMNAYGIRDSNDIDILVTPKLYKALKAAGWKTKQWDSGGEYLAKNNIEVDDSWEYGSYNPSPDEIIAKAVMMNGVPYAPLDEVLAWKKAFGRPKDLVDAQLIEAYLAVNPPRVLEDGTHEWVLAFLRAEGHNHGLADKLERDGNFHVGPIHYPIRKLVNIIGPDETYKYYEDRAKLDERIARLVIAIKQGWEPPPIIASNLWQDDLEIADGGHRQRALLKLGRVEHPVIFYFKDEASRREFLSANNLEH